MKFLKRKEPKISQLDQTKVKPKNSNEYIARGYARLTKGDYENAEKDFRHAISSETSAEGYYALGMVLKTLGDKEQAIEAFDKVLVVLESAREGGDEEIRRLLMLRLTRGHLNHLTKGVWGLRDDVWEGSG